MLQLTEQIVAVNCWELSKGIRFGIRRQVVFSDAFFDLHLVIHPVLHGLLHWQIIHWVVDHLKCVLEVPSAIKELSLFGVLLFKLDKFADIVCWLSVAIVVSHDGAFACNFRRLRVDDRLMRWHTILVLHNDITGVISQSPAKDILFNSRCWL